MDQTHTWIPVRTRSEEHTSELQSPCNLVCRLLLEKKKTSPQSILARRPTHGTPSRCPVASGPRTRYQRSACRLGAPEFTYLGPACIGRRGILVWRD